MKGKRIYEVSNYFSSSHFVVSMTLVFASIIMHCIMQGFAYWSNQLAKA